MAQTEPGAPRDTHPTTPRLPPRAITIHDVAQAAGVAASTVSRAFTNPQRVNSRTREHIRAVAQRLGYRPNPHARALPTGRTKTIALLVPDITNPHFFNLVRGAERQANAAGYTLVLGDTEESPEQETRHIERLARAVDGFLLAASRLPDDKLRDVSARHPLALVNREADGIPSVITDQLDGSRQIIEHLASLGHRCVAYLSGPRHSWLGRLRWKALSEAAARRQITATRLGPFPPYVTGGAAADAGLAHGATALVAHNDLLAIGVLRRLAERGVSVPADISVVGYDDIFGSDFCSPPLTTLAGPLENAGRVVVNVLLERIDRAAEPPQPPPRILLPTHLVIRGSSGDAKPSRGETRVAAEGGSGPG
jgi:DNA-binding LacI/PurR family transcriptional regulator